MRSRGDRESGFTDARLAAYPPALIVGLGLVGCYVLFSSLRDGEMTEAQATFDLEAAHCLAVAKQELSVLFEQARSTVRLFESSDVVEPTEFATFTKGSLERYPSLTAILWFVPNGTAPGAEYHVRYVEGPEAASFSLGSSLGNEPEVRDVLARAAAGSDIAVSAPFQIAAGVPPRVLAAVEVRSPGKAQGIVAELIDVERLLSNVSTETQGMLDAWVVDVTSPPSLPLAGLPSAGDLTREVDVPTGGRTWSLGCAAPAGFLAERATWWPWGVFGLGLCATALLATTVAASTGRARIQRLVERRSEDVLKAYDTLAAEAQERLLAVSEARRLESQLREIIDLVPSMIFVRDGNGRFLLANEATAEAYGTTVARLTGPGGNETVADRGEPPSTLREERELLEKGLSAVVPAIPFVDRSGRRRILRAVKIPCNVFGRERRALLCVATDITEQKHSEDILRTQYRILSEIASGAGLERVLDQLVGAAEEVVPGMRCSVLLVDSDGRHLHLESGPSLPDFYNEAIDGIEIGPEVGSCGAAAATHQRVVVEDVLTHPNWAAARDLAERAHIRASWSQPIFGAEGDVLGTFAMYYSEPRRPEPFEEEFLESMAHLAGIAIERARRDSAPSAR